MDHQPEDSPTATAPSSAGDFVMEPMPAATGEESASSPAVNGKNELEPSTTTINSTSNDLDEATIQQIVRFWNHPSLQQVPTTQKQEYLKQKGIRKEQIFQAWDRIVENQQQLQATTTTSKPDASSDLVSSFQAQQPAPQSPAVPNTNPYSTSTPHQHHASPTMPTAHHGGASPYNTTNPQPHYYDNHDYDPAEEMGGGNLTANSAAVIATVGGLLGLLAAATVRWLNGGDFLLFPPPSRIVEDQHNKRSQSSLQQPSERVLTLQEENQSQDVTEEEDEEEDDNDSEDMEEEEDSQDDPDLARYLASSSQTVKPDVMQNAMAQFMALSEMLQQHVSVQQRILQKLTSNSTSGGQNGANVTDLSMQVLRQQQQRKQQSSTNGGGNSAHNNTAQDPMLWYKLVEIQVELASLKGKMGATTKNDDDELEKQLSETLKLLQTVLVGLQPRLEKDDDNKEEKEVNGSKVESTAEGTNTATVTTIDTAAPKEDSNTATNTDESLTEEPSPTGIPVEAAPASLKDDPDNPLPPSSETATPEGTPLPSNNDDDETVEASILRNVRQVFIDLVRQNSDDLAALKAGFQMLFLYISNLSKNPHVPRYRKIYTSNASYNKVDRLQGGREFLNGLGFVLSADKRVLEWPPAPTELGDDGSPKTLTSQEKEKLVEIYHLSESAAALAILKDVSPQNTTEAGKEAALVLLEKALDLLPCPPASPASTTVAPTEPGDNN